ncbi:GDSL-like lipase/acylhydrolase family protein [Roseimicrobium gellanilyticum]|uniref:GDSL-like lipase/acylhydrolase family protein n=1 Tax=Roseimicrobium gellanilyticum TaxID=748857 RepID=A0A366HGM0_9BACT|nr:SGNH/GDSL hydrolase family protein [Roseimicrobium gellanilyticum]RBP41351.1 GDSL-like lipase/acylhydrolase family protein [Roseimicrobium gellanilyticum]
MKFHRHSPIPAILLILATLSASQVISPILAQDVAPKPPQKVLILGNSITRHGPKPDIGWTGNWGMAASAEDKDFVHLIEKALTARANAKPTVLAVNIAEFERNYASYDVDAKLKDAADFGADLIILAIGENVPALTTEESKAQLKASVQKLLTRLKANRNPQIIVRSSFWSNTAKDETLKQACQESGGVFVDISALGKDESNYARSERPFKHEGVARHPGDKGMQAIADAIVRAVH